MNSYGTVSLKRDRGSAVAIIALLALNLFLRCIAMGQRNLTLDEAFSFFLTNDSNLWELISPFSPVITGDPHPPMYYLLTFCWMKTGYPILIGLNASREFAFRFPHALLGTGTALVIFLLARRLIGKNFGFLVVFLHTFNSYDIQIVHQSRMYPMTELLASLLIFHLFRLREEFSIREALPFSIFSALLMLTHYASVFLIIVLWFVLYHRHSSRFKDLLVSAFFAFVGFSWWLPGFYAQFLRETTPEAFRISTGVIIPFTFFHFLTGDRGLSLGNTENLVHHIPSIVVFTILSGFIIYRFYSILLKDNLFRSLIVITLVPVILNWMATFYIERTFDATYYAIYSLPSFLILIGMAFTRGKISLHPITSIAISVALSINILTLVGFYQNRISPFEPWKDALHFVRKTKPDKIYLFPEYMGVLARFYAPDLSIDSFRWKDRSSVFSALHSLSQTEPKKIVLVLSHQKTRGFSILREFHRYLQLDYSVKKRYYNIRIFVFHTNQLIANRRASSEARIWAQQKY